VRYKSRSVLRPALTLMMLPALLSLPASLELLSSRGSILRGTECSTWSGAGGQLTVTCRAHHPGRSRDIWSRLQGRR
jgi:hypothetical protein